MTVEECAKNIREQVEELNDMIKAAAEDLGVSTKIVTGSHTSKNGSPTEQLDVQMFRKQIL